MKFVNDAIVIFLPLDASVFIIGMFDRNDNKYLFNIYLKIERTTSENYSL